MLRMTATPRETLCFPGRVWVTSGAACCLVSHVWGIKKPDAYAFKKKPSVGVELRAGGDLQVWEARVEFRWHRAVASKKKKMLRHPVSPKGVLLMVLLDLFNVSKMTNFNYDSFKVSKMTNFNYDLSKVSKMTNYSCDAFLWLKNY